MDLPGVEPNIYLLRVLISKHSKFYLDMCGLHVMLCAQQSIAVTWLVCCWFSLVTSWPTNKHPKPLNQPQMTSSPAWHMGFRTTTMKATACLGQKWWYWNFWEIVGKQQKNEGIIQNNTLKLWGFVIAIDAIACTSKTIGVKRNEHILTRLLLVSAARRLGSKHAKLRQKKPYKLPLLNVTTFKLQS